jgi:hypothetical protein
MVEIACAVVVAMHAPQHQISYGKGPSLHMTVMVPAQRLLVLGRPQECHVACFVELVHCILEDSIRPLLILVFHPRGAIV